MIIGIAIYFFYSRSHSNLARAEAVLDLLSVPSNRESRSSVLRVSSARGALSQYPLTSTPTRRVRIRDRAVGLLGQLGIRSKIVNPTPWREMYKFPPAADDVRDASECGSEGPLKEADVLVVLDISDVKRLGCVLAEAVRRPTGASWVDTRLSELGGALHKAL